MVHWGFSLRAYDWKSSFLSHEHEVDKKENSKCKDFTYIKVIVTYPQDFSENLKSFIAGLIQKDPL